MDADVWSGFDIYSDLEDGVTVENRGFAALRVGGAMGFHRVNLTTGKATLLGDLGEDVIDIALP